MADDIVNESVTVANPPPEKLRDPEPDPVPASDPTSAYTDAITLLKSDFAKFVDEAEKGFDNKAAAGRARKMSLALRKNLQEWRELSIANDKIVK